MESYLSPATSLSVINAGNNPNSALQARIASAVARQADESSIPNLESIERTAQDFEAVFISEMMKPIFESVEINDAFGGGKGEEVFRGMLVQEYGKMMAEAGSIGLSDQIKSSIIQMQANLSNAN